MNRRYKASKTHQDKTEDFTFPVTGLIKPLSSLLSLSPLSSLIKTFTIARGRPSPSKAGQTELSELWHLWGDLSLLCPNRAVGGHTVTQTSLNQQSQPVTSNESNFCMRFTFRRGSRLVYIYIFYFFFCIFFIFQYWWFTSTISIRYYERYFRTKKVYRNIFILLIKNEISL